MKTQHTPGPWEAYNGEVTTQRIDGRSYRRIAAVQDYGIGSLPEVDEANARLIAAAPELLAALEQFANCSKVRDIVAGDTELALAVFAARAAISKATQAKGSK